MSDDSFEITWRDGAYYVSIPNYQGGTVYSASQFKGLLDEIERLRESEAGERYEAGMYQALYEEWKKRAEELREQLVNAGWQPITSAPKNGEPIHLYIPINTPDRRILTCYWADAGWWICSGSIVLGKPTHWMPLAAAPLIDDLRKD